MNSLDLARPDIRALAPYSSARMEARGGGVCLNANESPWPPFGTDADWNRYPDPQPAALLQQLAALYGVTADQVLVGRGSDEGIDLLVRAFCTAYRDAILISPPTFGMYAVCARAQGASIVEAPLRNDFGVDADAVLAALTPAVKLVFVCAPNNPSGAAVPRQTILRLAGALRGRALLVVDEAYVEFAGSIAGSGSVAGAIGRYDNLVVLRTLSKAYALAGVRIGALLAAAPIVALLRKLLPPYPIASPCAAAALAALSAPGQGAMQARVQRICAERARMARELAGLPCVRAVLPSAANFLTVRFRAADRALAALAAAHITVRDVRHYPHLHDALRVTLGAADENDQVLRVLAGLDTAAPAVTLTRTEAMA